MITIQFVFSTCKQSYNKLIIFFIEAQERLKEPAKIFYSTSGKSLWFVVYRMKNEG
jgi:hypothetical protein